MTRLATDGAISVETSFFWPEPEDVAAGYTARNSAIGMASTGKPINAVTGAITDGLNRFSAIAEEASTIAYRTAHTTFVKLTQDLGVEGLNEDRQTVGAAVPHARSQREP